ncbi:hypothetical protein J6590_074662 [Homalodisca vitripennis]|nr:hypothetical protein J6590_074662 [Homalodisca vitripennis]
MLVGTIVPVLDFVGGGEVDSASDVAVGGELSCGGQRIVKQLIRSAFCAMV